MKKLVGKTKGGDDGKDDAGEDADEKGEDDDEEGEPAPSKKAKTKQSSAPMKKPAAATTKPQSSKKIESPANSSKNASFEFVHPVKKQKPRRFNDVTIYTDTVNKKFRVKPGVGRRDHTQFSYACDSREAWRKAVKLVKEIM